MTKAERNQKSEVQMIEGTPRSVMALRDFLNRDCFGLHHMIIRVALLRGREPILQPQAGHGAEMS
jgi:hypothetical protein